MANQAGETGLNILYEDDIIWFTQKMMAALFDVMILTINEHLKETFETAELDRKAIIRKF